MEKYFYKKNELVDFKSNSYYNINIKIKNIGEYKIWQQVQQSH